MGFSEKYQLGNTPQSKKISRAELENCVVLITAGSLCISIQRGSNESPRVLILNIYKQYIFRPDQKHPLH